MNSNIQQHLPYQEINIKDQKRDKKSKDQSLIDELHKAQTKNLTKKKANKNITKFIKTYDI
ncbi:unnamed protein product (macronuclear) [Paramecium tetraurelia]|uniref:Uncharacterized protein n=1 Tax=Paramecium tetraurelia TaxID=5888 RepID=A0DQT7_PARTE|nr:uncharacterized protein GSPATT00002804001 [Paramecium tetraurelia]CAK85404.1 unnamed protein product [Paramecium tetraurelia]|eukprot:XP_001452801.1 hypothetical protein (macronuclear) [Paramecium tetraurelia strain d4-2]